MTDRDIDADRFASSLNSILDKVVNDVDERVPDAIRKGVRKGAVEWRRLARELFNGHTYKKSGVTYETGRYAKSIRSHMLSNGKKTQGEVGAPSMPGLPHLLEKGHARVGGGRVQGIEHISTAADIAFDYTELLVEKAIDGVINGN